MCDINTGGCLYCSELSSQYCNTLFNVGADQWAVYCYQYPHTDVQSFANTVSSGSQAEETGTTQSSTTDTSSSVVVTEVSSVITVSATMYDSPSLASTVSTTYSSTNSIAFVTVTLMNNVTTVTTTSAVCTGSECANGGTAGSMTAMTSTGAMSANSSAGATGSASDARKSRKVSIGMLAGVICGGTAALALLCAGTWCMIRKRPSHAKDARSNAVSHHLDEKKDPDKSQEPSANGGGGITEAEGSEVHSNFVLSPAQSSQQSELDSRPVNLDSRSEIETAPKGGLGIHGFKQSRYAPTNPDLPPVVELDDSSPEIAIQLGGPGEAMAGIDGSPVSPPTLASSGSTKIRDSAALTEGTISPLTPAGRTYIAYSPSNYGIEPPSSMPKTVRQVPPSLPQEYSAVSLGSVADIYRDEGKKDALGNSEITKTSSIDEFVFDCGRVTSS